MFILEKTGMYVYIGRREQSVIDEWSTQTAWRNSAFYISELATTGLRTITLTCSRLRNSTTHTVQHTRRTAQSGLMPHDQPRREINFKGQSPMMMMMMMIVKGPWWKLFGQGVANQKWLLLSESVRQQWAPVVTSVLTDILIPAV